MEIPIPNDYVHRMEFVSWLYRSVNCQGTYEVADTLEVHPTQEFTRYVSDVTWILFCFVNKNVLLATVPATLLNTLYVVYAPL